jgi:WD40 repeat protein
MLSVSLNDSINILNCNCPDTPERSIQAHQVSITALHFDRTTSKIYTGSFDGVICTYDFTAAAAVGGRNGVNKTTTIEYIRLIGTY